MAQPEQRKHIRKDIRMPCSVQFSSGHMLFGQTKSIGLNGVTIELGAMPVGNRMKVALGDTGLLRIRFTNKKSEDSIRIQCQVTNMAANGMGLSIRFYELNKKDQLVLGKIIASGIGRIE
ncbi:MAG: PilZ domain-containing protein [Methylophagaceae bacterium]